MKDLSSIIRAASKEAPEWSELEVADVLSSVDAHISNAVVDWEPCDEEWGRVLVSDRVMAVVSSRFPLAVVLQNVNLVRERLPENLTVQRVESMEASEFAVDKMLLEEVFERALSDNLD